ncbi:MAG TPA: HU family DNA-binding protein [Thermoanaerobaculia bacterium]|nr:HU family DNA-binding protein [Thermoanaerobaculia bacterium]
MADKGKAGKTKAFLVDKVYQRHGALTKQEAAEVVDAIFRTVKASLVDGKPVRIQNFGVFEVVDRAGRAGVDPSSGNRIYIPPHKGLQFRPSRQLKETIVRSRKRRE